MVGARDAAIRPHDLAAGDVGVHERLVDGALDVSSGGLDSDAQMVGRTGDSVAQRFAAVVSDERCRFRGTTIDAKKVSHQREFTRVRTAICTQSVIRRTKR